MALRSVYDEVAKSGCSKRMTLPLFESESRRGPGPEPRDQPLPQMWSNREALRAFAMAQHRRLGRRALASGLPEDLLRKIAVFVGVLPSVLEAVSMSKADLRTILTRQTKRCVPRKYAASALVLRVLLPHLHPDMAPEDQRNLYLAALRTRDKQAKQDQRRRECAFAIRAELARCPKTDLQRTADLLRQLQRL